MISSFKSSIMFAIFLAKELSHKSLSNIFEAGIETRSCINFLEISKPQF